MWRQVRCFLVTYFREKTGLYVEMNPWLNIVITVKRRVFLELKLIDGNRGECQVNWFGILRMKANLCWWIFLTAQLS